MTPAELVIGRAPAADQGGARREMLGAVVVFLTMSTATSIALLALGADPAVDAVTGSIAYLIGSVAALLVAVAWRSAARLGGRWSVAKSLAAYAAFAVGSYLPFTFGAMLLWQTIGLPIELQAPVDFIATAGLTPGALVVLVSAVVAAPLVEEVVFRGFLQTGLTARLGALRAIFVTAGVFALLHVGSGAHLFLPIALLGVFLGWLRAWTGGLLAPVVVHAAHNALMLLMAVWLTER